MAADSFVPFPNDYFSDDSSYYGDDEVKKEYEDDLSAFSPLEFWDVHDVNYRCLRIQAKTAPLTPSKRKRGSEDAFGEGVAKRLKVETDHDRRPIDEMAESDKKVKNHKPKSTYFHNRYESIPGGKRTNESIADFLKRMPPSTSTIMDAQSGWIWCANPHQKFPDQETDDFIERGHELLEDFSNQRLRLESENPDKPPASITRMLTGPRKFLEHQIVELATRCNVLSGKWMLFPPASDVNEVWRTVAEATWEGSLGSAAKVAPYDPTDEKNAQERLICIYTQDFTDLDDVKYVLKEMKRLGLVQDHGAAKNVYYKCDAYTHLGIVFGNEWKLRASAYSSGELFGEMRGEKRKGKGMGGKKRW